MFKLEKPIAANLHSITNRVEKHGEDKARAVSFGLRITSANTILDTLSPSLRLTLYHAAPGQKSIDGVEETTPLLNCSKIEAVAITGCFEGWTLTIDHGIDEHDPIVFGACKVDQFRCFPKEGGSVELALRVGTSDVDADRLGIVGMKLGELISITLLPPLKSEAPTSARGDDPGALFEEDNEK